jgi:4-amino-4-deoxy-L-arabinose transferase-like glycosyltransferase
MLRRRIRPVDVAAVVAAAWFFVHAALYAIRAWNTTHSLTNFVLWQAGCFAALLLAAAILRPAITGVLIGIQWFASSVAIVAIAQDATFAIRLIIVLLWAACATCSMKWLLARIAGLRYATWGVASAAAFAALVPLCFLLGILHWMNFWIVASVAVATALPGAIIVARGLPSFPGHLLRIFRNFDVLELCWLEAIWLILAVAFVGAGASETLSDAVRVHLPYVHQLAQDQGFSHQYACWHRLQPMAAQSCYAAFAVVGSDAAAKWLSWLALVALVVLVADEVFRRSGSRRVALFAGAALLSCPVLVELATTLYIDHIVTLFCTAGFIVLFRALNPPCWRGILLSAAIMASMDQVKYPGLIFSAVWGVMLFVTLLRRCPWPRAVGWSLAGDATLVAAASPWYIYVYAGTGNPFFPYLNKVFPSPYWSNEVLLHDIYESFFKVSPGIAGALSFPWDATYQTSRFFEGFDGFVGFWVLALAPCWLLASFAKRQRVGCVEHETSARNGALREAVDHQVSRGSALGVPCATHHTTAASLHAPYAGANAQWWDLVVAGVVGVAGVVSYTPYVRYWLPVYPLLVAGCAIASGSLLGTVPVFAPAKTGLSPLSSRHPALRTLFGLAFLCLLICPLPFNCYQSPWNEYSRKVTREEQLAQSFPGYQAVEQFNQSLGPNDGVICTGYEGVYLVGGRPYEYNFWWNPVHRVHDVASFGDFCRRHNIRYWIVDHARTMLVNTEHGEIQSNYWTEARTVAARGTLTIYDVASPQFDASPLAARHQWAALLDKSPSDWKCTDSPANWITMYAPAAAPLQTAVLVAPDRQIGHRLPPPAEGQMCTVQLDLNSSVSTYPMAEIYWYDAHGKVLDQVMGAGFGKADYRFCIYSQVPPGAKSGWVRLRTWQGAPVELTNGSVSYRPLAVPATLAARNTPRKEF